MRMSFVQLLRLSVHYVFLVSRHRPFLWRDGQPLPSKKVDQEEWCERVFHNVAYVNSNTDLQCTSSTIKSFKSTIVDGHYFIIVKLPSET